MNKLTDETKRILDIEQAQIIDSIEKYIYVSACPRFWENLYCC